MLTGPGVAVTTVRYDGMTHDFMMLNPFSGTHATRAAVTQAISIPGRRTAQRLMKFPHRSAPQPGAPARSPRTAVHDPTYHLHQISEGSPQ